MVENSTFLETENLILRPLHIDDLQGNYAHWLNDGEIVQHNSHGRFPQTMETLAAYVKSASQDRSQLVLAVVDKASQKHIGNISLQGISWIDRSAEIAFLLGEKDFWGKNIMFEAGKELIRHGFESLNLHRIHCGTSSENVGMQKLALKLGMQQEGIRREAIFNQGKYFDIIEFGILND